MYAGHILQVYPENILFKKNQLSCKMNKLKEEI